MPATPKALFAYLDELGIAHKTVTHAAAFTVEEARELRGAVVGGHTKNLFLRDKKGEPYLVVASEDAEIELRALHRLLGATGRFSFGSAELMRELLGVEPGSVTPFAAINDKMVLTTKSFGLGSNLQQCRNGLFESPRQDRSVSLATGLSIRATLESSPRAKKHARSSEDRGYSH